MAEELSDFIICVTNGDVLFDYCFSHTLKGMADEAKKYKSLGWELCFAGEVTGWKNVWHTFSEIRIASNGK